MPKFEDKVQIAIIDAVRFFFESDNFGFKIPYEEIAVRAPSAGGQARRAEDFGRKPYDVAFYSRDTFVVFFEVKEREQCGRIPEYKDDQCEMLKTLAKNGVEVQYAYNTWDVTSGLRLGQTEILKKTHVRDSNDMRSSIKTDPLSPAQILEDYLRKAVSGGSQNLLDVLHGDFAQFDALNSMPLMILANLTPGNSKFLIDSSPRNAMRIMKKLFNLEEAKRVDELNKLSGKENADDLKKMALAIFGMKDSWVNSSQQKLMPPPGGRRGP